MQAEGVRKLGVEENKKLIFMETDIILLRWMFKFST